MPLCPVFTHCFSNFYYLCAFLDEQPSTNLVSITTLIVGIMKSLRANESASLQLISCVQSIASNAALVPILLKQSGFLSFIWEHGVTQRKSGLKSAEGKPQTLGNQRDWLEILRNMSFFIAGQEAIFRHCFPGSAFGEFLDVCHSKDSIISELALTVLRNVSFLPAAKITLISNEQFILYLFSLIERGCIDNAISARFSSLASSTLWSLVYNNQKGKSLLKNSRKDRIIQIREKWEISRMEEHKGARLLVLENLNGLLYALSAH